MSGVLNIADDILVFEKDSVEHKDRLVKLMQRLADSGLTLNPDKREFGLSSVTILGHTIAATRVAADPGKVDAIVNARAPSNVSELRGFWGLVQYVGRYIPELATLAAPLRELTKKSVEFRWTRIQEESFQEIKRILSASGLLAYFDRNAKTRATEILGNIEPYALWHS